jgi:hypothetical protein
MALTLAHPKTTTPRTIQHHHLTPLQTDVLDFALTQLGTTDGLIEDHPPVTDPGHRLALSNFAARTVGITITPTHEIAQCNTCALVMDGALANEDHGRIRCDDCRNDWQNTLDDGAPDRTEYWD